MANRNIETAIRDLVTSAVQSELAPYGDILKRLAAFVDGAPRRGPGRPSKAAGSPPRARRAARGSVKKAVKAGKKFGVGDVVTYQQGRGTFGAKIAAVDSATGTVTLERLSDKKRVQRPATKIAAADVAPAVEHDATAPFLKPTPAKKGPKAGKEGGRKAAGKAAKKGKRAAAKAERINLVEGQLVVYRQGKGAFRAEVVAIDRETGAVKVKRASDGKVVTRPASKLQPTDAN